MPRRFIGRAGSQSRKAAPSPRTGGLTIRRWLPCVVLAASGCSDGGSRAQPVPEFTLTGGRHVDDQAIGRADALVTTDRYLWIADGNGDPFLHLVDLQSGAVSQSFGRRGDGPGDYRGARPIFVDPDASDGVIVYDGPLRRLTRLRADAAGGAQVGRITTLAGLVPIPRRLGALGSGYVGWLADSAPRWVILDADATPIRYSDGPLVGPVDVHWQQRVNASSTLSICGRPDGSGFAVAYGSAGRIELYDSLATLLGLAAVPDSSDGDFVTVEGFGSELRWRNARYFYGGCAATDRFLFALYSGKPEGKPEEMNWGGSTVQVFDWKGHLISMLRLPVAMAEIAIDRSGVLLFGSSADGSVVHRFDVPTELQGPLPGAGPSQ